MTPPLPRWLREARVPGYVNIYEIVPDTTRVYGTESLYGDWNGHTLLLAKDFAPSSLVRERIGAGHPDPYSHEPGMRTNMALAKYAQPLVVPGMESWHCGVLYGSALAGLLRNDGRVSGSLPDGTNGPGMAHGIRVLRFVVESMPNLRQIVCMGVEAWICTANLLDLRDPRDSVRATQGFVATGRLRVVPVAHPAARGSAEQRMRGWSHAYPSQRAA